ncbi:MAG TPA: disulfide bond formation protein B [Acidimicrobiales bacterium]|nr:disulfide bond formation protein B [Acidimicrobiales bacterium]
MTTDQVSLFLALLAVLAETIAAVVAVTLVVRLAGRDAAWPQGVLAAVRPLALPLAAAVATVATLGSLYYSEVANFPPCRLCWYQRICMYPLAVILIVAALRRDRLVRWYGLPLALIGAGISTWHVLVERYPTLESGSCDPTNPCSLIWVEKLGYLTIPTMALSGFAAIALLLVLPEEAP